MTERLYYRDCYSREFTAVVEETAQDGLRLYLNQSLFYPASGGQPSDSGELNGVRVVDVVDEGERVAHVLEAPLPPSSDATAGSQQAVTGCIDWARRFDHMQQHTGQHLLSVAIVELYGFPTLSFHLGAEASTIDIDTPSVAPAQLVAIERRVNELVVENLPVAVAFHDQDEDLGLRKASSRTGTLRVVSIGDLDRSACGGTHVRHTGEIGPVMLRRTEKIRGTTRLEFLCGHRALRRARADFEALTRVALTFSSTLDEAPALVAAQAENALALEKANRRMAGELAGYLARERYRNRTPDADGIRRVFERRAKGSFDEATRAFAQSYTAGAKSLYLLVSDDPPSVLLAVSPDTGMQAGPLVKAAVTAVGGRGGGSATLAQGSVPQAAALDESVVPALRAQSGF
jgi:alanyl-tRNA synthetase